LIYEISFRLLNLAFYRLWRLFRWRCCFYRLVC